MTDPDPATDTDTGPDPDPDPVTAIVRAREVDLAGDDPAASALPRRRSPS